MSAHDVFFVQSRPAHEFPEHALQENIGPGHIHNARTPTALVWMHDRLSGCNHERASTGQAALKTLRCRFLSQPSADPTD